MNYLFYFRFWMMWGIYWFKNDEVFIGILGYFFSDTRWKDFYKGCYKKEPKVILLKIFLLKYITLIPVSFYENTEEYNHIIIESIREGRFLHKPQSGTMLTYIQYPLLCKCILQYWILNKSLQRIVIKSYFLFSFLKKF